MTYLGYALSVLLMGGAVGALFLGAEADIAVPLGASGVTVMLAVEMRLWWRRGLSPDRMETICGCLALLCVAPIYYLPDETAVLLSGFGGFIILIFLGFIAQIWGKIRDTRALFTRWQAHTASCSQALCDEIRRYREIQRGRFLWL